MEVTDKNSIVLSDEDIKTIINAVESKLSDISLDDIEFDTDESSYSCKGYELMIESLPGLMVCIDWTADYWYRRWTEYWTDPVCYPVFDDGAIEDVWCDGISLEHDEHVIEDCEAIGNRICDTVYGKEKSAYDARMAAKKTALQRANCTAKDASIVPRAV